MNVLKTIYELRARAVRRGGGVRTDWKDLMGGPPMQRWKRIGEVFEGIGRPWATMGAVACRLYKPERTTKDIDILIRARDRASIEESLARSGFTKSRDLAFVNQPTWSGTAWTSGRGKRKLDVLSIQARWVDRALALAEENRDREGLRVLPFGYLVLTKIESMRGRDVADLTELLGVAIRLGHTEALERSRALVRRHLPDREEEFDQLLQLGEWEFAPE
ncbi:MAG: hypothetical protein HY720_12010 [Planctomycetes bacterium]|nr:hypothetical protein [Planctomycetota bacterium]